MIEIIPNWHPIWVHFAVALLATSTVASIISLANKPSEGGVRSALVVARWTLWIGVVAAMGALLTGYWASTSVAHDDLGHANMMDHRNWALVTAPLFLVAALLELTKRAKNRLSGFSLLFLLLGSISLVKTGLEGAENVYEHGLGVQRLPNISEHEHSAPGLPREHEHGSHGDHQHGEEEHMEKPAKGPGDPDG